MTLPKTDPLADGVSRRILLAPPSAINSAHLFKHWINDPDRHETRLAEVQRLRGRIYLEDGAIERSALDADGRHHLAGDDRSWHVLALDESGQVQGCIRSLPFRPTVDFGDLTVRHSPLAACEVWGHRLKQAVEFELERSRAMAVDFFEIGGWALARQIRCTRAALHTALSAYALAQILGGGVGLALATVRNQSAAILKRIGGQALGADEWQVPQYFDPRYGCEMEALTFNSGQPLPGFGRQVAAICNLLQQVPVYCSLDPLRSSVQALDEVLQQSSLTSSLGVQSGA